MKSKKDITAFPCTACGKCCQNVGNSSLTVFLDRGDSTCRHFDDRTKLCTIYADRPLVCRVEDYYKKYLSHSIEWDDFVKINLEVCNKL